MRRRRQNHAKDIFRAGAVARLLREAYCLILPGGDDRADVAVLGFLVMSRTARSGVWLGALGLGLLQVVGTFGAADNQPGRRAVDVLAVVLVLTGPVVLLGRHRWPLVAAVVSVAAADVYVGFGYPYGPIFVSVVVALFTAVQAGSRRWVWWIAGAGYAGHVAAMVVDPRGDGANGTHLAVVAGWLVVVLAISETVRVRRERELEVERFAVEEQERRVGEQRLALARDLHDILGHNLSLINVQASVALHLLDAQPERARPALAAIKEASRESLHGLRTALGLLRGGDEAPRAPAPGLADVDVLIARVRASGVVVRLERQDPPASLPSSVELVAYRIVQEALTNVTRHARAQAVTVRLGYQGGMTIEVTDDGIGGAALAGDGILGMRERAGALGGTVEAGPCLGGGFRVAARLPVDAS